MQFVVGRHQRGAVLKQAGDGARMTSAEAGQGLAGLRVGEGGCGRSARRAPRPDDAGTLRHTHAQAVLAPHEGGDGADAVLVEQQGRRRCAQRPGSRVAVKPFFSMTDRLALADARELHRAS